MASKSRIHQAPLISNGEADEHGDISFDVEALEVKAEPSANGTAPDPFDPAALRISTDIAASLGVKKELLTVPTRKPDKAAFVRVHPDDSYSIPVAVIEMKEDRDGGIYLVSPQIREALATETTMSIRMLFTAITRQGVVFLWPVRMPGADGKVDAWSQSAIQAAQLARKHWVRVTANTGLGAYEVVRATAELAEPEWPDKTFRELLAIAFKDKFINTADHPVLKKLRGEV